MITNDSKLGGDGEAASEVEGSSPVKRGESETKRNNEAQARFESSPEGDSGL